MQSTADGFHNLTRQRFACSVPPDDQASMV